MRKIWENIKGLFSLVIGLAITGWMFFRKRETVHYPRQVIDDENLKSYRGPVELVEDEKNPGSSKCISCQMCVRACPGSCLTVEKSDKSKAPVLWKCDFSYCSLCGSCVEVCPTKALKFSHNIYFVAKTREEIVFDLLSDLKKKAAKNKEKAA